MRTMLETPPSLLAAGAALFGMLCMPMTVQARQPASDAGHRAPVEAEFRGCEAAGWCRFWIDSPDPAQSMVRVRPDDVSRMPGDDAVSVAVRDRLNALLSNMIHQAKHVVLHDLRQLDDGTFAATITVTGIDLASDPVLLELRAKAAGTNR